MDWRSQECKKLVVENRKTIAFERKEKMDLEMQRIKQKSDEGYSELLKKRNEEMEVKRREVQVARR